MNRANYKNSLSWCVAVGLLFASWITVAAEKHSAFGIHGMAIFSVNNTWYASHMPLANSIHAQQILMQVSIQGINTEQLSHHKLVSFEPAKFDLHQLQQGKINSITGQLYIGHFERNGTPLKAQVTVTIDKILLNKTMTATTNGQYWRVPIDNSHELLVHQISHLRSFDQIILIKSTNHSGNAISTKSRLPLTRKSLIPWLNNNNATWIKQIYLETQDFR